MGFHPRCTKWHNSPLALRKRFFGHKRFVFLRHDYPLYPPSRHCRSTAETTVKGGTNIKLFGAMRADEVVGCSCCGWFDYSIMRIYVLFVVFRSTIRNNIKYSTKNDTLEPKVIITSTLLYYYGTSTSDASVIAVGYNAMRRRKINVSLHLFWPIYGEPELKIPLFLPSLPTPTWEFLGVRRDVPPPI